MLIIPAVSLTMTRMFIPTYGKQISTLEDLIESQLKFGGTPSMRTYFNRFEKNRTINYIVEHYTECTCIGTECRNQMIHNESFSVISNQRAINFILNLDENRDKHLYMLPLLGVMYNTFYLTVASPFKERIDHMIMALQANGLIAKLDVYEKAKPKVEEPPSFQIISLMHIKSVLIIYSAGMLIAISSFAIEIILNKY